MALAPLPAGGAAPCCAAPFWKSGFGCPQTLAILLDVSQYCQIVFEQGQYPKQGLMVHGKRLKPAEGLTQFAQGALVVKGIPQGIGLHQIRDTGVELLLAGDMAGQLQRDGHGGGEVPSVEGPR